jgi:hypothetical protein
VEARRKRRMKVMPEELEEFLLRQFPPSSFQLKEEELVDVEELVEYLDNQLF